MSRGCFHVFLLMVLTSCAIGKTSYDNKTVSDIKILTQGNISRDNSYFYELCGKFRLTREQVKIYYFESRASTEQEIHDSYNLFPCYSTGTININGEKYMWKIRAGGVGAFHNKNKILLRVCDEKCCKLTKGIC